MPLTGAQLGAVCWAQHLATFPLSVSSTRENTAKGVPKHLVMEKFYAAYCGAIVTTLGNLRLLGNLAGTAPGPGTAPPVPFVFASKDAAVALFLLDQGWLGSDARNTAKLLIKTPLAQAENFMRISGDPSVSVGAGAALVTPAVNAALKGAAEASLNQTLLAEFTASAYFQEDDIAGAGLNKTLAKQLPNYAAALATGIAGLTASLAYTGGGGGSGSSEVIRAKLI